MITAEQARQTAAEFNKPFIDPLVQILTRQINEAAAKGEINVSVLTPEGVTPLAIENVVSILLAQGFKITHHEKCSDYGVEVPAHFRIQW